jgi:putative DNA base modification enzyme with NMAD domain
MKIVFSRKGFDSQYGRVPNAVLPDGTLVSFPIEDKKSVISAEEVRRCGESVGEMVEQLTGGRMSRTYRAHLDPDLDAASYPRRPGWRPVLGQTGSSLAHLRNQCVSTGDLFLFFGWYQPVERVGSRWAYLRGAPPVHALWGWLHVVAAFAHTDVPAESAGWLAYHPHLQRSTRKEHTLFIASDALQIDGRRVPGAGYFPSFSRRRVLSAPGENKSVWRLPSWMHPSAERARFSYIHDESRWTKVGAEAHVQTVGKGQEIVMTPTDSALVDGWIAEILSDVPSTG